MRKTEIHSSGCSKTWPKSPKKGWEEQPLSDSKLFSKLCRKSLKKHEEERDTFFKLQHIYVSEIIEKGWEEEPLFDSEPSQNMRKIIDEAWGGKIPILQVATKLVENHWKRMRGATISKLLSKDEENHCWERIKRERDAQRDTEREKDTFFSLQRPWYKDRIPHRELVSCFNFSSCSCMVPEMEVVETWRTRTWSPGCAILAMVHVSISLQEGVKHIPTISLRPSSSFSSFPLIPAFSISGLESLSSCVSPRMLSYRNYKSLDWVPLFSALCYCWLLHELGYPLFPLFHKIKSLPYPTSVTWKEQQIPESSSPMHKLLYRPNPVDSNSWKFCSFPND
jgi:hypothetical protein